jgi:hypothetical protein
MSRVLRRGNQRGDSDLNSPDVDGHPAGSPEPWRFLSPGPVRETSQAGLNALGVPPENLQSLRLYAGPGLQPDSSASLTDGSPEEPGQSLLPPDGIGRRRPGRRRILVPAVAALTVAVAGVVVLTLGPGSDSSTGAAHSSATAGATAAAPDQTAVSVPTATPAATRDNSGAIQVTLAPGSYTVGESPTPGHYVITADSDETGPLRIESAVGPPKANELLGEGEFGIGSATYTTDLAEGDVITWLGNSTITLTPAATSFSTDLTPGNWIVGTDIPAGTYLPEPIGQWQGNLLVRSSDGNTLVNLLIDPTAETGAEPVILQDGQRIDIAGAIRIHFEPA